MALPPNPGDAKTTPDDDPLGGMDPMAWLESLAKRQGANVEELTTSADIDVPTPPADSVIDEPGYTPGYESASTPAKAKPVASVPDEIAATQQIVAQASSEPAATTGDDPLGGMDPMAWLESLAKRQGANSEELTTTADLDVPLPATDAVIDEPGYTPGYESFESPKAKAVKAEKSQSEPEPELPVIAEIPTPVASAELEYVADPDLEAVAAQTDDPLGGMDPMAWLESLAKRQGANSEELMTTADIDVPLPPADAVIDEPGYTPGYESAKPEPVKAKVSEPEPEPEEPVIAEVSSTIESVESEPAATISTPVAEIATGDDPLAGMDPMAWLESLAKRQGANVEELTTSADLDVPMPPADAVIDEPGYVDYDPFSAGTKPRVDSLPSEPAVASIKESTESEPLQFEDSRQWLDTLAEIEAARNEEALVEAEPEVEIASSASIADIPDPDLSEAEAAEILGIAEPVKATVGDPLGGMDPFEWLENLAKETGVEAPDLISAPSTEAQMRASLDLTALDAPTQPEALITTPEATLSWLEGLSDTDTPTDDSLEIAAQAGLPDWLTEPADEPTASKPALSVDIQVPDLPADVPTWLLEKPEAEIGSDFVEFTSPVAQNMPPTAEIELTAEEINALTMPTSEADIDSWAEALDEEYERRQAGDESIPDWYTEAMERAEEATGPMAAIQLPAPAADSMLELEDDEPLLPAELPDWLRTEEPAADVRASATVPDWLHQVDNDAAAPVGEADLDWIKDVDAVEVPDWLKEAAPASTISEPVAAVPPAPKPAPQPVPTSVPPAASKTGRIRQAREHATAERLNDAMKVYQQLIDDSEDLEDVRADLRTMAEAKPKEPRIRRLLGDTHMRLNDLQAALDAYRSALDQL
ncbi:MAG: hypothetical protein KF726_00785 [Anaerolineae bacterium]|nr:hypothetical protein [Anaerolineae bacterium]